MNNEIPEDSIQRILKSRLTAGKKSLLVAYLLLFSLGLLGAHRYYLRRWSSGLLYTLTLGFLGLGVLVDVVLLYFIFKHEQHAPSTDPLYLFLRILFSYQEQTKEQEQQQEQAVWMQVPRSLATRLLDAVDNLFRVILFFGGTIFVILFSLYSSGTPDLTLYILMTIILMAGYIGPMGRMLDNMAVAFRSYPTLARVPLLPDVVDMVAQFHQYYRTHKPRSVFYYWFYPVVGLYSLMVSKSAREEFALYHRLFVIILLTFIIDSLLSYASTYPPYLGWQHFLQNVITIAFLNIFIMMSSLMPTVTTCFKFRFSGKRIGLSWLTTVSLLVVGALFYQFSQSDMVPFLSKELMKEKMLQEKFRTDLTTATDMFLKYYYQNIPAGSTDESRVPTYHQELTHLYRQHLGGLAKRDEAIALSIVTVPDVAANVVSNKYPAGSAAASPEGSGSWLGVHYQEGSFNQIKKPVMLFLISPEGTLYQSWQDVPKRIQGQFVLLNEAQANDIEEELYEPSMISQAALMVEFANALSKNRRTVQDGAVQ